MDTDVRPAPGAAPGDGGTPPAPGRRGRGALQVLGAAVALVLVFVGVRLTSSPTPAGTDPDADPGTSSAVLFDQPTHGSLAGDADWVAGVLTSVSATDLPGTRHVAFAGDVSHERVALVLGRDGSRTAAAWLVGPADAAPGQMTLATTPLTVAPRGPLAFWDVPEPALGAVLVVVTMPGDAVDLLSRRFVTADGQEGQVRSRLPVFEGVTAVPVANPITAAGEGAARVIAVRDGVQTTGTAVLSDRALALATAPVDVADPRGLRAGVDEGRLQELLHQLLGTYGVAAGQVAPVLLAAGPIGSAGDSALLVGATLPSGATVALLGVAPSGVPGAVQRTVRTAPAPAGTALLDRVVAVPAGWAVTRSPLPIGDTPPGWLVVSAPAAGTRAEVLDASGTPNAAIALTGGAGVGAVPGQAVSVRVTDPGGAVLGQAPVAVLTG